MPYMRTSLKIRKPMRYAPWIESRDDHNKLVSFQCLAAKFQNMNLIKSGKCSLVHTESYITLRQIKLM